MGLSDSFPLSLEALDSNPLVSVLMPGYNYEQFIEEAIDSVLSQSYEHIELVVCDDGSTDRSGAIARKHAAQHPQKIKFIQQPNGGVARALNTAYEASSGEIVCLLDADDFFTEEKVARIVLKFQDNPDAGFILHCMLVVDERGGPLYPLPSSGQFEEGWIADRVVRRGGRWRSMPASALSFRRQVAEKLFPLPVEQLRSMADAYLYMLAPLLTVVGFVDKALAGYRLHGSNLTGTLKFDLEAATKFMEGMERVHESIARKACPELFETMPLQLDRHLTYREQAYLRDLFGGVGRMKLFRTYADLLEGLRDDDLYGLPRKIIGMIANGVALGLPLGLRSGWMQWALGARWRRYLRKAEK